MDFYVILGVERGATVADVKRAYKRLARRYHPDINPGDRMAEAHFRQIAQAYETLIDPDRRRRYDATGTTDQTQPGPISRSACTAPRRPRSGICSPTCSGSATNHPRRRWNVALTCIRRSP